MDFLHVPGIKPAYSAVELGRGADGVVIEVLEHPELVIKDMNHPFRLGRNRVALELRVLHAVLEATNGRGATRVFNHGTDKRENSWLVRLDQRERYDKDGFMFNPYGYIRLESP